MDLDSSLDDIIKKRSHSSNNPRAGGASSTARHTGEPYKQQRHQSTSFRRSAPAHTEHQDTSRRFNSLYNSSRVKKPTPYPQRASSRGPSSSILDRIGPARGRGSTSSSTASTVGSALSHRLGNQPRKPELDPSQIVITKSVKKGESVATTASPLTRIKQEKQQQQKQQQQQRGYSMSVSAPLSLPPTSPATQKPSLSIRGLSGSGGGLSIRGEGSPARVLISNLDPGANAEDVKAACSSFGTVLHCEVLTDPSGRSYGEAEVEFSTKQAALDCIKKLDNEIADGRVIRAILRSSPRVPPPVAPQHHPAPMHNFATQTLRSVITPSRAGYTTNALPPPPTPTITGKLYSDQLLAPEHQLGYPDYPPPPPPQSRWYS